jgi:hypothetical protein
MPSPRLFGFRAARHRTVDPGQPVDLIRILAEKICEQALDVAESAAWGISPAESYIERRLHNPKQSQARPR